MMIFSEFEYLTRQINENKNDESILSLVNYEYLIMAIKFNMLDTIKWIHERKPEIEFSGTYRDKGFPFIVACAHGHLDIAKFLYEIIPNLDVSMDCEDPLRYACREGHLHIIKWLFEKNPGLNISACFYKPFTNACENGHLEIAKWIYSKFPLIREELHNQNVWLSKIYSNVADKYPEVSNWLKKITLRSIKEIIYSLEVKRNENTEKCCICYETSNIETSCGHYGCEDCFSQIADHECPYCRQFITDYFKIVD